LRQPGGHAALDKQREKCCNKRRDDPGKRRFLQTELATQNNAELSIEIFQYGEDPKEPPIPTLAAWAPEEIEGEEEKEEEPEPSEEEDLPEDDSSEEEELRAEFDQQLADETRKAFESGRERGRIEGRQLEREAQETSKSVSEEQRTKLIAETIDNFVQERDRYLRAVEHEVVNLALAVAARILRREAQMDPLLLTGAVRVALGQLAGSTQVRMRVPPNELEMWTEAMALVPNLAIKPVVISGDGMRLGECVIETELGSVDLGIRTQLSEIERGFFDRAGMRRAASSAVPAAVVPEVEKQDENEPTDSSEAGV
jgi:flagellar assembly protein FliH